MRPFWHALSAVLVDEPRVLATPGLVRMILASRGEADVVYAGDRMWPSLRHGTRVRVTAMKEIAPQVGEVLLAAPGGVPDLLRVERVREGTVVLRGDADPVDRFAVQQPEILARARVPSRKRSAVSRILARNGLDLVEALRGGPDPAADLAETVKAKYDAQAPFYEASASAGLDPALLAWFQESVAPGAAVLVAGSGTGREAFALASAGFRSRGIDAAPAMVAASRREAGRRGSEVRFDVADLRNHDEPPGSLDAVLFTYDVYSFLPGAVSRIRVLRGIRRWLGDQGVVFLSARFVRSGREEAILTLQHLRGRGRGCECGESHTRWIDVGGNLRRSFVQYFLPAVLEEEIVAGGFETDGGVGGHVRLRPRSGART